MRARIFTLALCLIPTLAFAAWHSVLQVSVGPPPTYSGPGDISVWRMYFASRAFTTATRGNKIWNVCNVADVACADVSTDATTGLPTMGLIGGSSCAVVTCTIKTWYDLTGNGFDLTTTTIANRFTLNTSAVGGHACGQAGGTTTGYPESFSAGSTIPQTYTFFTVANRTGSLATIQYIMSTTDGGTDQAQIDFNSSPGVVLYGGTGSNSVGQSATDNAFHAILGMANGTSSKVSVDGATATTGDAGTGVATTSMAIGKNTTVGGNNFVGLFCEGGIVGTDIASSSAALSSNAHSAYGF